METRVTIKNDMMGLLEKFFSQERVIACGDPNGRSLQHIPDAPERSTILFRENNSVDKEDLDTKKPMIAIEVKTGRTVPGSKAFGQDLIDHDPETGTTWHMRVVEYFVAFHCISDDDDLCEGLAQTVGEFINMWKSLLYKLSRYNLIELASEGQADIIHYRGIDVALYNAVELFRVHLVRRFEKDMDAPKLAGVQITPYDLFPG